MSSPTDQTGIFLLSLDTELAWGTYDCFNPQDFSADGQRERQNLRTLLDLFREFGIRVTWGVVGHLFYEKCEECETCPVRGWEGKYASYGQIYNSGAPLWYGRDVIESILAEGDTHEIAFHGYTHRVFGEDTLNREEARFEIKEWLRLAGRIGLTPRTVIFPRNVIGHLDLFREYGFTCYRGTELPSPHYSIPVLGRGLRRFHRVLSSFLPAAGYRLNRYWRAGLLNLPSSQHLFGFGQAASRRVNALNLHRWVSHIVAGGIRRAAREKNIFHLRAHPNDFRAEKDFEMLRGICCVVADEVKRGRLVSLRMDEAAGAATNRSDQP